ncbi:hypothetical protein EMO89_01570 [Bifidobacterium tissieri]|uniref:Uncharacterized protein n=1 Tax=Bifidobacterium tissieri TaxID=1630162 RepID=A0A5M9ZV18_9BIFI|nr:hypothetical protein [Bifidobacterium tissieri]KAA8831451.1 hypothetical protein EMO89_01570 [Bifidobacterium tissieri]
MSRQPTLFDQTPDPWAYDPWAYDPWATPTGSTGKPPRRIRKPMWLDRFCDGSPDRLTPARCACGQWVISERRGIWANWDPGVVTGLQVRVALICGRPLCAVAWHSVFHRAVLRESLRPVESGHYLCLHECGKPPLSDRKPDMTDTAPVLGVSVGYDPPPITDTQLTEFERIWAMPVNQLPKGQS